MGRLTKEEHYAEFNSHIREILDSDIIYEMKNYMQHGGTTCFQHCINVAYYNYRMCRALRLDTRSAVRAGMLHDFFLYDWHAYGKEHFWKKNHALHHPRAALENARKHFAINDKEADIILKHMFPLAKMPRYRETFIIALSDKYCTLGETFSPVVSAIRRKLRGAKRRLRKFQKQLALQTGAIIQKKL